MLLSSWFRLVLILLPIVALPVSDETPRDAVGLFSDLAPGEPLPSSWETLTFPNISRHTDYELIMQNGRTVVRASSRNAASGLIKKIDIAPDENTWLSWHWKIEGILPKGDVRSKAGDDYPARIYVAFAFESGRASWWQRTKHEAASLAAGRELPGSALNYIWANKADKGIIVENAFAKQVKMIAVQSGNRFAGQWVSQRRNLAGDYRQAFGRKPPDIIGIAIMTDTDNTEGETTAYYGDIYLELVSGPASLSGSNSEKP